MQVQIPADLICPICKELLKDAVMMPCCAGSACDECGRNGIIDSEGSRCPVCGEQANPEELIPYRLFRDKVDRFRNQTGYSKPSAAPAPAPVKPTLPDIVLPDPADSNFKFDSLMGHRAAPGSQAVKPPDLNLYGKSGTTDTTNTPGTPLSDSSSSPYLHSNSPLPENVQPRPRSPHTPTATPPPASPGTPTAHSPARPRTPPIPPPVRTAPAPAVILPGVDTTVPPPSFTRLPPSLAHYPPPHLIAPPPAPAPFKPLINPAEDPLAAFEAAMRKLDSKKASRVRGSPPRAYTDRPRSRER